MIISRQILPRACTISALNRCPKLPFQHPTNYPTLHPHNSHADAISALGPALSAKTFLPFSTSADSGEGDLPEGLQRELMPRHVALILDGNKRWAELRGLVTESGHEAGLQALLNVMGLCAKWGIEVATFFLFSTENWNRPKQEIEFVMWRFQEMLVDELQNIVRQGIRISTIGDMSKLPDSLQQVIKQTKEATKDNTKTHIIFAISYSGKNDIVEACKALATKVRNGEIEPKDVTETMIKHELETKITSHPCPDLLIRTSGEVRISNFMLWQMAYSELYFTKTFWPDFGEAQFTEALQSFQKRGRRFGGR